MAEIIRNKPDNIGDVIENTPEMDQWLTKVRGMSASERAKAYIERMTTNLKKSINEADRLVENVATPESTLHSPQD